MALDLSDRPVLGPVEPVQVVDLLARQHRTDSVIRQNPPSDQHVVVGKIPSPAPCGAEVVQSPTLALELSCCLQDQEDAVFGRVSSALRDCERLNRASSPDTVPSPPDSQPATYANCPDRLADIRDQQ